MSWLQSNDVATYNDIMSRANGLIPQILPTLGNVMSEESFAAYLQQNKNGQQSSINFGQALGHTPQSSQQQGQLNFNSQQQPQHPFM